MMMPWPNHERTMMQRTRSGPTMCGLLLSVVLLAGCRAPANIPVLEERSVISVKLTIKTEPQGARVFAENFRLMGEAPVTHAWQLEKLTWSDGKADFRMLPKGTHIEPGEELSVRLAIRAEGHKEKETIVLVPFSGREETITRKVALEKK